jgi:predicted Zn-dependent peptidase
VAAAGAVRHDEIVALAARHFADLPGHAPPAAEQADYRGGEFREARDLDQVHIVLGFPACAYEHADYYPTLLLSTLLGGGMSSRLFQEIREKRGLVYSIYAFTAPYRDSGLFGIYAGTGESEAEELLPVTLDELAKVQEGITSEELARARAQVRAGLLMSMESTGSRCEQIARQLQVFGRIVPMAETLGRIAAVTEADVRRAARSIFRAAPTLSVMGPGRQVPGRDAIVRHLAA